MFGLFSSPSITDPDFGELKRSRGMWRGLIAFPESNPVQLIVAGTRSAPDSGLLNSVRFVPDQYRRWKAEIEKGLFEHFSPYADAVASGEMETSATLLPEISMPGDVWHHVRLEFVTVTWLEGTPAIEFGYHTAWDEEHTLGARFSDGRFIELCGSILRP